MGFLRSWLMVVMPGTAAPKRVARTAGKRDTGAMLHQVGLKFVEASTQDSFLKTFRCRIFWVEKKSRWFNFFFGGMIPLYTFIKLDKQSQLLGPSTQILG